MILFGKEIYSINPLTIEGIVDDNQDIEVTTLIGEVVDIRIKGPYDEGQRLYDGALYDGTGSIGFRFYSEELLDIHKGMGLKLQGAIRMQKKRKERTMFVWSAETHDMPEEEHVTDGAGDFHRVEFQTFSFMSEMRGAVPVRRYFEKAKALGHKAVALTDAWVTQGLPEAAKAAKETGVKPIYGITVRVVEETPIVFHPDDRLLDELVYSAFDVESTGFSARYDDLTEIGVARLAGGMVESRFGTLIKGDRITPEVVVDITSITDEERNRKGLELIDVLRRFKEEVDGTVLVAHNAFFDLHMIEGAYEKIGMDPPTLTLVDTLKLARVLYPSSNQTSVGQLAKKFGIKLEKAHRALDDATATASILKALLEEAVRQGVRTLHDLNQLTAEGVHAHHHPNEITLWVKNQEGMDNLNRLVSISHIHRLSSLGSVNRSLKPVLLWQDILDHRDGLVIGSGSHKGTLFTYALEKPDYVLEREIMSGKYDVIELQPADVARHLWYSDQPRAAFKEEVEESWQRIYRFAQKHGIPVIATGHAHYIEPKEAVLHNVLVYSGPLPKEPHKRRAGKWAYPQGPCHFRTTAEMVKSFPWLSEEEAWAIVVTATNDLADEIELVHPIPVDDQGHDILFTPTIDGIDDSFRSMAFSRAEERYGVPLPSLVRDRLEREVSSIIGNGYSVIYMITRDIVQQSIQDGYLVGSRGSVGSSFAATMTDITEVNPLPPHYYCPSCYFSVFFSHEEVSSGFDLPYSIVELITHQRYSEGALSYFKERLIEAVGCEDETDLIKRLESLLPHHCPACGVDGLKGDGQDIPFETFLGFKGDKIPDIDLNFSGEYQQIAHRWVLDRFGEDRVFRAGTISTIAEKTAYSMVRSYYSNNQKSITSAEINRLASLIQGVKTSTGQHPGGLILCPDDMSITKVTGYQYPANNPLDKMKQPNSQTTHLDFNSIHDSLLKLDLLGHDNPTLLRYAFDFTGVDPRDIPGADPLVLALFHDPKQALGHEPSSFRAKTGTLGLPEMGTTFVQDVIAETKPKTYGDLLTLSGLTHGTDVYLNNAQTLIAEGTATIRTVIGCRDDIMRSLSLKGLEGILAFTIMESVRKGKGLKEEWEDAMKNNGVPDWYLWSCKQIKYMFPRAHASAYVTDAMRMGFYKVYHPTEFYASVFSGKYNTIPIHHFLSDIDGTNERMDDLKKEEKAAKGEGELNRAKKLERTYTAINLALEAKVRGIRFGGVRMYESHATKYLIDSRTGELIAPFSSLEGVGPVVAHALFTERQKGAFRGLKNLKDRTGVNTTNLQILRDMGCLTDIEEVQPTFF